METVAAIILVAFFGVICWTVLHPPAEFSIHYSRGAVQFKGKFPRSRYPEVEEFFKREFAGHRRITVLAIKARQGGLRIVVRGTVTEGDRQRIRNFFQIIR
jgi:hypothetical protein